MAPNFKSFIDPFLQMPCCDISTVTIDNPDEREQTFFTSFMSKAKNAIVLGHHVTKKSEWTWYATHEGSERCDADDHRELRWCEICARVCPIGNVPDHLHPVASAAR